jgi:hypothetical protein
MAASSSSATAAVVQEAALVAAAAGGATNVLLPTETVEKEGFLRKRSGRMHRWTNRYFVLTATKISYKVKQDAKEFKGTFDLAPGSIVTDAQEESIGTVRGKKIFVFWLVWPFDKNSKANANSIGDDSDEEGEHANKEADMKKGESQGSSGKDNNKEGTPAVTPVARSDKEKGKENKDTFKDKGDKEKEASKEPGAVKAVRDIVEREESCHRKLQQQVEEQINRHEANDKTTSFRYTVAAAAAGGVVVGALTAGIGELTLLVSAGPGSVVITECLYVCSGLIPYLAVVGTVAAVGVGGGGLVALSKRRPFDSRLMLGIRLLDSCQVDELCSDIFFLNISVRVNE